MLKMNEIDEEAKDWSNGDVPENLTFSLFFPSRLDAWWIVSLKSKKGE